MDATHNDATTDHHPASPNDELLGRVMDELLERIDRGEQPAVEDYVHKWPQLATVLRRMLPTMQAIRSSSGQVASGPLDRIDADSVLGDYRIIREVGRGGMGIVFEALQTSLGRRVALKVLPSAASWDDRQLKRFQNEAQAAAGLNHPNIVPVYGIGSDRHVHYYAMQFVEGETLAQRIADQRLRDSTERPVANAEDRPTPPATGPDASTEIHAAWDGLPRNAIGMPQSDDTPSRRKSARHGSRRDDFREIAECGRQVADALHHAHEEGVLHRDIKPSNLMRDTVGKIWVTDFGLARIQSDPGMTMTGEFVGTLRYMSPEQTFGKQVGVDHRTDIYSLGATLYELLTLEPACPGADRTELLREVISLEPRPPRRDDPSIPVDLETIVLKALAKNPAERYETARHLSDDLLRFLNNEPILARPVGTWQRARKWASRRQSLVVTAGVSALVVAAALGISAGWVVRDRGARLTNLSERVEHALAEAHDLQQQGLWREAQDALRRAEGLLAGSEETAWDDLAQRLDRDTKLAARLEEIRLRRSEAADDPDSNRLARSRWDSELSRAFRDHGLDVDTLPQGELVARIRTSRIRDELISVLDEWAIVRGAVAGGSGNGLHLLTIARDADNNPTRSRLREALISRDREALFRLAASPEIDTLPPSTVVLLGQLLWHGGAPAPAVRVLTRGRRQVPDDFWINHWLATYSKAGGDWDSAARFYTAAVSTRPQSAGAHGNLAEALRSAGHTEEAIEVASRAIELKPELATAYVTLGAALSEAGRAEESRVAFQRALQQISDASHAVAVAYQWGDLEAWDEAAAALRLACQFEPQSAPLHAQLGQTLVAAYDVRDGLAAFRKSLEIDPSDRGIRLLFGKALLQIHADEEAVTVLREASRLDPTQFVIHRGIGLALTRLGRFSEALESHQRCRELTEVPELRAEVDATIVECQELLGLEQTLPAKLGREDAHPTPELEARELLRIAQLLEFRRDYATATRYYERAFAVMPPDTMVPYAFDAARSAVFASDRDEGANLSTTEDARLRALALAWLSTALRSHLPPTSQSPHGGSHESSSEIRRAELRSLVHWQKGPELAAVRDRSKLETLSASERLAWGEFWTNVAVVVGQIKATIGRGTP